MEQKIGDVVEIDIRYPGNRYYAISDEGNLPRIKDIIRAARRYLDEVQSWVDEQPEVK